VQQTTAALMGYGTGLLGLVAIKVLAPGFYASQDIRTPVRIALMVLVLTQLLNLGFVPLFAHAGLTLAIGVGALVNALALLIGLIRRGSYRPQPGWAIFSMQVALASALLGVWLIWAASSLDWNAAAAGELQRLVQLALVLLASAGLYFVALWATGIRLAALLKPQLGAASP